MAGSMPLDDLAVVLYANSGKLLEERFAIASLLWSNGVRAGKAACCHLSPFYR